MYVGQWPTFHGPMILSYILKTTWWNNVILEVLLQCDTNIELKLYMSYILKTIWWINVVLEIFIQCDTNIELKLCRSVTYISWSSDFALYLEDYLMDKCHNWNIGFMWYKDLPHKMYVGQWPTFHFPVILTSILKTFWWRNGGLKILIQYDIKFDLQIYM